MECGQALQSFDAVTRWATRYDPAIGCAVVQIETAEKGDPIECNSPKAIQRLVEAYDDQTRTIRVNTMNILAADLCSIYTPRSTCPDHPSTTQMFMEAVTIAPPVASLLIQGAGTAAANGEYCPDGTENGFQVWTKIGGVRLLDSIYWHVSPDEWWLTIGGTAMYVAITAPPNTWLTAAGSDPAPTYGISAALCGGQEEIVVLRGVMVTDELAGCSGCERMEPTSVRVASSFVTDGVNTYVVLIAPSFGDYEYVDCDWLSGITLASAALEPIGLCGIWAWKVTDR